MSWPFPLHLQAKKKKPHEKRYNEKQHLVSYAISLNHFLFLFSFFWAAYWFCAFSLLSFIPKGFFLFFQFFFLSFKSLLLLIALLLPAALLFLPLQPLPLPQDALLVALIVPLPVVSDTLLFGPAWETDLSGPPQSLSSHTCTCLWLGLGHYSEGALLEQSKKILAFWKTVKKKKVHTRSHSPRLRC